MMRLLSGLARCRGGATAAEFALVLPLLIIFLLGVIDVGRLMWTWNRAEKATQMGVRAAVVMDFVPSGLATYNFVSGTVAAGSPVPIGSFPGTTCRQGNCYALDTSKACGSSASSWGYSSGAFTNILNRAQAMMPEVQAANLCIDYENIGLGYAGDPNGSDVAPLVRVRLRNLNFTPLVFALFGASMPLPDFSAALTMEDGSGTVSN